MSTRTVYLFPDTNVFVQCKPLHAVDWAWLNDADEVVLIVSRPVQNEIDEQKQKRKGRVADRARLAHGEFRRLLVDKTEKVVREAGPRIRLTLGLMIKPTPDLKELDDSDPDDRLVACAHAYRLSHPERDVRVLSHDGGPLASAQAVDVRIAPVPDSWLLEPEASDTDRKLAASEAENDRLRKNEPAITLECLDDTDASIDALTIAHETFEALTDSQIKALKQKLEQAFPMRSDFGSSKVESRPVAGSLAKGFYSHESWEPAKQEDIEVYRTQTYPAWLSTCEYELRHLHHKLAGARKIPLLRFEGENTGTRPAQSVLVEILAQGPVAVRPPPRDRTDSEDDGEDAGSEPSTTAPQLTLPGPPGAPYGRWVMVRTGATPGITSPFGGVSILEEMRRHADPFRGFGLGRDMVSPMTTPRFNPLLPPSLPDHDPNAFYYKGRFPREPVSRFELTCDQWRHSTAIETFDVEVHVADQITRNNGLITLSVHAENLTDPAVKRVRVSVEVKATDMVAFAEGMIDALRSLLDAISH